MENLESSEDEQDENAIVDASISGLPLKDVDKLDAGCSCLRKCLDKLERQNLIEHIQNIRELSKSEKDMYIMGLSRSMDLQQRIVMRISNGIDLVIVLMELTSVLLLFVLFMTLARTC